MGGCLNLFGILRLAAAVDSRLSVLLHIRVNATLLSEMLMRVDNIGIGVRVTVRSSWILLLKGVRQSLLDLPELIAALRVHESAMRRWWNTPVYHGVCVSHDTLYRGTVN